MRADAPDARDRGESDPVLALAERAPFAVVVSRLVRPVAPGSPPQALIEYVNDAAAAVLGAAAAPESGLPDPGLPDAIARQAARTVLDLVDAGQRSGTWWLDGSSGDPLPVQVRSVFLPPDRVFTELLAAQPGEPLARAAAQGADGSRSSPDPGADGFVVLQVMPGDDPLIVRVSEAARDPLRGLTAGLRVPAAHPLAPHLARALPRALARDELVREQWEVTGATGPVVHDLALARVSPDHVVVTVRDVTAGVRLQGAAAESARLASRARRLLHVALDSSPVAFTVYRVQRDAAGIPVRFTVEFLNEPAVPSGLEVRDVVGLDLLQAYPTAREIGIEAALVAAADDPQPLRLPVVETDADGRRRYFEAILSRVDEDLVVSSFVDVTELRRIQQELAEARDVAVAASQAKSDFLATVTHELRTPLTTMVSATELLLDGDLDGDQRALVLQQRDGARMLLALVSDILDLSKIEAGRLELELVEVDMADLVDRTMSMFTAAAAAKGLRLRSWIAPSVPSRLVGDPTRLQQILLNLLSNAVKFTESGQVRLTVWVMDSEPERCTLQFRVSDTGIGVPAGALRDIFRPFRQVAPSTSRDFGGTGLGLSIAQRLVTLMSGTIGVSSVEGEGTTVTFTAQLRPVREDAAARPDGAGEDVATGAGSPIQARVLLAEDNDTNRLLLARMLRSLGCDVVAVTTGVQAVEAIEGVAYDLVLMDLRMPDMDGLAATRRIRELEAGLPAGQGTPILALTANATSDVVSQTRGAGMDGFLSKPVALADLRAAVREWARRRDG